MSRIDRDRIIRVILEGRDRLSGSLRSAIQNVDAAATRMERSFRRASKASDDLDKSTKDTFDAIDKRGKTLDTTRRKAESLSNSVRTLRRDFKLLVDAGREVGAGGSVVRRGPGGRFVRDEESIRQSLARTVAPITGPARQFRQGLDIAAETEKRIRAAIPETKEEINTARKELRSLENETDAKLAARIKKQRAALDFDLNRRDQVISKEISDREKKVQEENDLRLAGAQKEADELNDALEERLRKEEDSLKEQIRDRKRAAEDEIVARDRAAKKEIRELREQRREADSKAAKDRLQDQIDEAEAQRKADNRLIREKRDDEISLMQRENRDRIRLDKQTTKQKTTDLINGAKEASKVEMDGARAASKVRLDEIKLERRERNAEFGQQISRLRERVKGIFRERRGAITDPNEAAIVARETERANQLLRQEDGLNRIERAARRAGAALGDFGRGFRRTKEDIRSLDDATRAADNRITRFGQRVGQVTKNLGTLVNLRWFLLVSALQLFGTVIAAIGINLLSIASSAALAAAAIGSGLAAAFAEAAGPAALFAAVTNRVGRVMDASTKADQVRLSKKADQKQADDERIQSAQRLADAQYNLKRANEAVGESEISLLKAKQDVVDAEQNQLRSIKDLADARKEAARGIVDANFEERDAALSLKEAELAVIDAKERLRKLEQEATGDTNVKEAQAAVREAQARLAIAKQEGDQFEINKAQQQLALAKQSLDDINASADDAKTQIQDAQLQVQRAELNREQAVVRNKRAREDAARTRKEGIEGNAQVISARKQLLESTRAIADAQHNVVVQQRALRDSIHSVVIAKREEKDAQAALTEASSKQTAAQKDLQNQLSDLSPAERGLFKAFRNIQQIYRKQFRPITDIVIRALTDATNRAAKVLIDPRILNAFRTLATAVAKAIRELAKFFTGDTFVDAFADFTKNAANNLPLIVKLIENLALAFVKVAKAGEPILNRLLRRLTEFTGRIRNATNATGISRQDQMDAVTRQRGPTNRLDSFLGVAAQHLDSWIKLGNAIGRVVGFFIPTAAPTGRGLIEKFTEFLNNTADWLEANPEKVRRFFEQTGKQLEALGQLTSKLGKALFLAFTSEEAEAFTQVIVEVVLPGLTLMLKFIGLISRALIVLFNIPGVKLIAQILVAEKALNRIFPASQKATDGLKKLFLFLVKDAAKGFAGLRGGIGYLIGAIRFRLIPAIGEFALAVKTKLIAGLTTFAKVIRTQVIPAIVALGRAMIVFIVENPIIAIIAAIIIALVLLDRKFHFIIPTIKALGRAFQYVFNWIKDHWKLLIAIILAPFAVALLAIIKWRDKIIGFFKSIVDWVRDHWKTLATVLVAIFLPGAAILLAIIKFKDKIIGFFGDIKNAIINAFKGAIKYVKDEIGKLGGFIRRKLEGIPVIGKFFKKGPPIETKILNADTQDKKLIQNLRSQGNTDKEILDILVKRGKLDKKKLEDLVGKAVGFQGGGEAGISRSSPGDSDTVPAMLTPGEWVLNKTQIVKLAKRMGQTVSQTKAWLFGTNMGQGSPGPKTTGTKPSKVEAPFYGKSFTLAPHVDQDNNTVWFIQFDDGTFGQVTSRDAKKIQQTRGNYIPNYVKRNTHGFSQYRIGAIEQRRFSMGGAVPVVQKFAQGGIVMNSPSSHSKRVTVPQHFEIHTQGESDWDYIMRKAAQRAQEAF